MNTLLTIQEITFETLFILKNQLKAASRVFRGYDDQFAVKGRKIGATLSIRKPPRFIGRSGQAVNIEGITDTFVTLTLDHQEGVDTEIGSAEMELSIDDLKERVLKGAAATIANRIDVSVLKVAYQSTANLVGTPGVVPSTFLTYLQATQKLDEMAAPDDEDRTVVINPAMRVTIVDALKALFNPQTDIGKQYKTGKMGTAAGLEWYMDQNVQVHTIGAYAGTPLINGNGQTGPSLLTKGWTASTAKLAQGDVFTIANVNAVNPQSRQSTQSLQQFVVLTPVTADAGQLMTINIFPAIVPAGQFQNVDSSPVDGAAITMFGTASIQTAQGLAFHKTAFTLACVDLAVPGGVDIGYSQRDPDTGVSLRFVRQYVASIDQYISRFDVLYGVAPLYAELACRIAS